MQLQDRLYFRTLSLMFCGWPRVHMALQVRWLPKHA